MIRRQRAWWASGLLVLVLLQISAAKASEDQPLDNWAALDRAAMRIAASVSILAADVTEGRCEAIHDLNADHTLAIGSSFKI